MFKGKYEAIISSCQTKIVAKDKDATGDWLKGIIESLKIKFSFVWNFHLMTDWSVTSHIYVKHILRRFFFCSFVKIFSILEVTLKYRGFRSHFWKVSCQIFWNVFFFVFVFVENIAYTIWNRSKLLFFQFRFRYPEN